MIQEVICVMQFALCTALYIFVHFVQFVHFFVRLQCIGYFVLLLLYDFLCNMCVRTYVRAYVRAYARAGSCVVGACLVGTGRKTLRRPPRLTSLVTIPCVPVLCRGGHYNIYWTLY